MLLLVICAKCYSYYYSCCDLQQGGYAFAFVGYVCLQDNSNEKVIHQFLWSFLQQQTVRFLVHIWIRIQIRQFFLLESLPLQARSNY